MSDSLSRGSMRLLAQCQSAAGAESRPATDHRYHQNLRPASKLLEPVLPPIDRCTARRGRGAAVDKQFLALHMRGIVRGEEQHRLRDMIGFADAAERRGCPDAPLERLLGLG